MNVSSSLKEAKAKIDSLDAELILLDILKEEDRSFLTLNEDLILSDKQLTEFKKNIEKRERGVPLAYILGHKEFYGRRFNVSEDVLIPRPESEAIIEFVKEISPQPKRILDVGTGSGCLAISLKLEIPEAEVFATDISDEALNVAKDNTKTLGAKIQFYLSDLLADVSGNFSVIVANLPYVDRTWDWVSGIEFEPEKALFAEDSGLFLIKKLIKQDKGRTKYLVLESDTSQQDEIVEYAKKSGFNFMKKDDFVTVFRAD